MDVVAASIPLFFLLIGLELVTARVRRRQVYRLSDTVADLSCGILSQLTGIGLVLLTYAIFAWVESHWAVQRWIPGIPAWPDDLPLTSGAALASWAVVFLLVDLCYYWSHRLSHEVNLLWAGHVVHHSSEEYNLTVALRQSSLHGLFSWIFYLPLAFLGVPWVMFAVCHGLNLIYQFWIHTREIHRLGPLERVMNTPSHHRVHHGVNPKYQDRNYAGVFIIWDRLFGSFTPEEEEPVLVASVTVLRFAGELRPVELAAAAFYIALSLSNLGSLLESARWVTAMEIARLVTLVLTAGVLLAIPRFPPAGVMAAGGFGVLSLLWFGTIILLRGSPLRPSDGLTV